MPPSSRRAQTENSQSTVNKNGVAILERRRFTYFTFKNKSIRRVLVLSVFFTGELFQSTVICFSERQNGYTKHSVYISSKKENLSSTPKSAPTSKNDSFFVHNRAPPLITYSIFLRPCLFGRFAFPILPIDFVARTAYVACGGLLLMDCQT